MRKTGPSANQTFVFVEMRRGRSRAWIVLAVWTVITVTALTIPIDSDRPIIGRGFDKVVHTGMFTAMGVLAQAAAPWFSLLVVLPVAVGTELLQKKLPHRTFDRVDLLANVIGVLLGVGLFETSVRLSRR